MLLKIRRMASLAASRMQFGAVVGALLLPTGLLLTPQPTQARVYRITRTHRAVRHSPNWGCWVDIFAGPDYAEPHRRIMGPIDLANLRLSDKNWGDTITSIKTGPRTWVRVFKDTSYRGEFITIGPGRAFRSLRPLKFKECIDSMTVRNHPFY